MHEMAQQRLVQLLDETLPKLEATEGRLDLRSVFTHLRPVADLLDAKCAAFLGESPALTYLFFPLMERVRGLGQAGRSGTLAQLFDEATLQSLRDEIVDWWKDVPRRYAFWFPLPGLVLDGWDAPVPIADGVRLEYVEGKYLDSGVLSYQGALAAALRGDTERRMWVLRVEATGLSARGDTAESAAASAISKTKQILLLANVEGVLSERHDLPTNVVVRGEDLLSSSMVPSLTMPPGLARALAQASLPDDVLTHTTGLLGSPEGFRRRTAAETVEHIRVRLERVGRAINLAARGRPSKEPSNDIERAEQNRIVHAARLATAAQWLFDAGNEPVTAIAYVHAAISFEALYGGGKKEPVVETLANRVAYSLARNAAEREELRRGFVKFYDARSSIVHSGSTRLRQEEFNLFHWGKQTLRRALHKELRMIEKPEGS